MSVQTIAVIVALVAGYFALLLHYRESEHRDVPPVLPVATPPRARRHRMTPEMRKEVRWICVEAIVGALTVFGTMWAFLPSHKQDHDCD
jgi:hypothetical protein